MRFIKPSSTSRLTAKPRRVCRRLRYHARSHPFVRRFASRSNAERVDESAKEFFIEVAAKHEGALSALAKRFLRSCASEFGIVQSKMGLRSRQSSPSRFSEELGRLAILWR